jgi:hypothetical protein
LTGEGAGQAIEPRNQPRPGCRRRQARRKARSLEAIARASRGPRGVGEPWHVRKLHAREPGEPVGRPSPDQGRDARGRPRPQARDERCGQSDRPVVPAKLANKTARAEAEPVEERGLTKGNSESAARCGHSAALRTPDALDRVRRMQDGIRGRRSARNTPTIAGPTFATQGRSPVR